MKYVAAIVLLLIISSCYTRNKAAVQHGKAVTTFPEIGAAFCAITYPPRDSIIKGDTVSRFDTIIIAGDQFFDTVRVGDTIRITKVIKESGVKIIEKHYIHDTLQIVNDAEVKLWQIRAGDALAIAKDKTIEADKWRRIAKKRFWIIVGLGAGIAIGVAALLRRRLTKIK